MITREQLVQQLRNTKAVVSDLEDSLREHIHEVTENPYASWLEYLHIELRNTHSTVIYNRNSCKKDGLSIELIQCEARLDCLIQLIKNIPLVFVPEELKKLYELEGEEDDKA
jgi:hypothetical protein